MRRLRRADRLLSPGMRVVPVWKHPEAIEAACCQSSDQYGVMKAGYAKRLKELAKEIAQLKAIVTDPALEIDMRKE